MQNLLIVENDLTESHFLINSVCKKFLNIRLYAAVSTGIEAINIITKKEVDIIILDLKLPDMTGIDVINFISKNNLSKYNLSVIVIIDNCKKLSQVINSKYVFSYCAKSNSIDFIIEKIDILVRMKEKECKTDMIKEKIKKELEMLHFNFSYIGTKYLHDCIYECYYKNVKYDINLNKTIYPIISKRYHQTIDCIRTNIFQSITKMYFQAENATLSTYFGYTVINKPKMKEVMFKILEKLYDNMVIDR
mgnify:CR=1 FL=1